MKLKSKMSVVFPIIIIVLLIIVGILLLLNLNKTPEPTQEAETEISPSSNITSSSDVPDEYKKYIKNSIEKIGELSTAKYDYTDVTSFNKSELEFWGLSIPWINSQIIVKYSGTIKAGIDFTKVEINVDEETKTIDIALSPAHIISSEIDLSKCKVYNTKKFIFDAFEIDNAGELFDDCKKRENKKAENSGLLKTAEDNAKATIVNLVNELYPSLGYSVSVRFVKQ